MPFHRLFRWFGLARGRYVLYFRYIEHVAGTCAGDFHCVIAGVLLEIRRSGHRHFSTGLHIRKRIVLCPLAFVQTAGERHCLTHFCRFRLVLSQGRNSNCKQRKTRKCQPLSL